VDTGEDSQPAFASSSVLKASAQESIHRPSQPEKPVRQTFRRPLQVVAIAGVGLFLFFLCGSLGVFGTWAGLRGLFPAQDPTVPPTVTATQASSVQDTILNTDNFSDPNSGWPAGQNAQAVFGYQPDGYHILVSGTNNAQWVYTDRVYDNASLHVDATPVTEGVNGYYGLLCRIQDDQNFYYFVIQRNGSYAIGKYKDAEFGSFFPEGWRQSNVINTGSRLQADCTGNLLRLYVNNVMLGEVTDPDFTSGFSGILAATLDDQDFEVRFNNFLITKADQ
jgi:hypothetical protein